MRAEARLGAEKGHEMKVGVVAGKQGDGTAQPPLEGWSCGFSPHPHKDLVEGDVVVVNRSGRGRQKRVRRLRANVLGVLGVGDAELGNRRERLLPPVDEIAPAVHVELGLGGVAAATMYVRVCVCSASVGCCCMVSPVPGVNVGRLKRIRPAAFVGHVFGKLKDEPAGELL